MEKNPRVLLDKFMRANRQKKKSLKKFKILSSNTFYVLLVWHIRSKNKNIQFNITYFFL